MKRIIRIVQNILGILFLIFFFGIFVEVPLAMALVFVIRYPFVAATVIVLIAFMSYGRGKQEITSTDVSKPKYTREELEFITDVDRRYYGS